MWNFFEVQEQDADGRRARPAGTADVAPAPAGVAPPAQSEPAPPSVPPAADAAEEAGRG